MRVATLRAFLKGVFNLLFRAGAQFFSTNAQKSAASISYYVLFSMVPLLIFIVGTAGLVLGDDSEVRQDIIDEVTDGLPVSDPEGVQEVEDAVNGVHGTAGGLAGLVALVAAVWGASSMLGAVRYALNIAFDDTEWKRPFVPQKLLDLSLVVGIALAFIASIGLNTALQLLESTSKSVGGLSELAHDLDFVFDIIAFMVPTFLAFAGFLAAYCLVPSRTRSPAKVWPGALVAALLFQVASIGFGIYLERFGDFNLVFGALGAVAVFLFWVYLNASIMIFGAEVAAEYPRLRAGEQAGMPGVSQPLGQQAWGMLRGLFVRDAADSNQNHERDE
jgi:membrane protein